MVLATLSGVAQFNAAWADPAEVESLITQGNDLRRQHRDAQAVPLFKKAFDIDQTPRTAGQLGLAELAAGYPVEAADHLALALESPGHPWVASNRPGLERMLTKAQAAIGELAIEGTPVGAAVSVNGLLVGALPLTAPVRVPAGRVVVNLSAPGHAPVERILQVGAKQTEHVAVSLEKTVAVVTPPPLSGTSARDDRRIAAAGTPGSGEGQNAGVTSPAQASSSDAAALPTRPVGAVLSDPRTPVAEPPSATSALRIAAWVTGGAAVAALATGYGLQHESNNASDEFGRDNCQTEGNKVIFSPNMSVTMDGCKTLFSRWHSQKVWSIASYAGGGILAVTSAVLFWFSSGSTGSGTAVHAHIQCAPGLGALLCRGEF